MKRHPVRFGTFATAVAMTFGAVSASYAQQTRDVNVLAVSARNGSTASATETVLSRPVTIELERVSITRAVNAVAKNAGVHISYWIEVLDRITRPVSLRAEKLPLGEALDRILVGTGLQVVPTGPTELTLRATTGPVVQGAGTIVGKVVNAKTKQPVANVNISLDDATKGVVSGSDGTFRMTTSPGAHVLHAKVLGFTKQMQRVTVADGQSSLVDFALEPSTSVLDEVVVTGTVVATERKAIPMPITVITAKDIETRGITRVDQLFRGEVPGLLAYDFGSATWTDALGRSTKASVYARGAGSVNADANPLKTYVDGVELLDPSYLGTIDPKSIERIEIITGPQAATLYGSGAMGGVMQIFTKRGNGRTTPDLTLSLKYGVMQNSVSSSYAPKHDHGFTATGGTGPDFSYSANLSYQYTGQWQPALYSRASGASIGATHTRGPMTMSGSYAFRMGENGTMGEGGISPAVGVLGNGYNTPYTRKSIEDGDAAFGTFVQIANNISQRVSTSRGQTVSLNADYRMMPIWQHHLTVGTNLTSLALVPEAPKYFRLGDTLYATSSSSGQRTTASYNMTLVPRIGPLSSTLTFGGNGSWGNETTITGCWVTNDSPSYINCDNPSSGPTVTRLQGGNNWGGFGSAQIGVFEKVFLSFGLRGERNPNYGSERQIDWTPSTGATFSLDIGELTVKLLGSYGQATRPPLPSYRQRLTGRSASYTPSEYIYQFESSDLGPEYSSGPQGGIELYYGNRGSLTINHYQQTIADLIQRVLIDTLDLTRVTDNSIVYLQQWQYLNAAKVRQKGWEGTGSLTFGGLMLKGTYSWTDSRVLALNGRSEPVVYGYVAAQVGQTFKSLPTHTGNLVASYARGGSSVTVVTNYIGSSLQYWRSVDQWYWNIARIKTYVPRVSYNGGINETKPGYTKSDILLSQRLNGWTTATLNVMNAGNTYDSDLGALFPTLGRQTMLGLSVRFPHTR